MVTLTDVQICELLPKWAEKLYSCSDSPTNIRRLCRSLAKELDKNKKLVEEGTSTKQALINVATWLEKE